MHCLRLDSIPGPLAWLTTALQTALNEIPTNAVSRCGYEPTTVPIALGMEGAFPLHIIHIFYIFSIYSITDDTDIRIFGYSTTRD